MHKSLPAENGDDLYRYAILSDDDGTVRHDAAKRGIAGTNLGGNIHTAAAHGEFHIQSVGFKVSFALGQLNGPKCRKDRRSRKQVRHVLEGSGQSLSKSNERRNAGDSR